MSPEQLSLAVAFVVESSLVVAQEWRQVLLEYVQLLLKRLADTHPNFKLRIAFVSYGTADTLPSPLICKRFFADYAIVAKELKDAITNFGLGQINSGGARGMAALEGLVATLELFDVLQTHTQGRDNFTSHIFHIAASPPDGSIHPCCNESPAMDQVNWETLPLEIKKRNIHYTSINLRTNLSDFSQLHSAAVVESTTPWFNVRPSHTLLLAAFSTPPQQKGIAIKRPGETQTESTPETKRPRLQTKTGSPKVIPQSLGATQPTTPASNPIQVSPSRPSQIPTSVQPPPRLTRQHVMEGLRKVEERIQAQELALATAQSEGNAQEEENISQELKKSKENHAKFQQFFNNYHNMIARQQVQQAHAHAQSHLIPHLPQSQGLPAPPFSLNGANINLSTGGIPANQMQMQHVRSLSNSAFQPPLSEPIPPNTMTAQMQKANELQTRMIPPQMSPGHSMGLTPQKNSLSGHPDSDPASSAEFSASGLGQSLQPEHMGNAVVVWSGSLNWSGQGTSGKKEVCTYVVAISANPAACHADTWPKALSLVPTREPGLTSTDLQIWIKRFRPAFCHLQVSPRGQDSNVNQSNYDSLVQLLREKKLFATAAWTTPSGAQENNVVVFPIPPRGLAGAFFPINGIPEMPKPSTIPKPMAMNPFNIPPAMLSQMQQFTPEQRTALMAQLVRARQQQQQSQQPNQDGTPVNLDIQSHANSNMGAALRAMNNLGAQGPNMNSPAGFPRPGPSNALGGVQGNLSYEMLQSFMQRNADGGMSMNQQS